MSLKLVAIDLDSTLLREDKSYDVERFDQIVETLINQGVTFVIASGNDNTKIKSYISNKTLKKVYVAGNNGNDVEQAGKHIHTNTFSREALKQVSAIVDADDDLQLVVNTQNQTFSKYIYEEDQKHVSIYYDEITFLDSYEELPENEEPVKGAILSSKTLQDTKVVLETIENEIDGITSVTSGDGWLDTYSVEGGKGSAVQWLQKEKDILVDETIAFGDSLNDGSMMEFSKYSVAMENADKDLKKICAYEIGHHEDQAVLDVLEQYIVTGNMEFMENYKK